MRKFLGVSLVAVLAVSPMMAQADVATVGTSDTVVGVASTKYVKEAYNAMAGAVNAELANKQGTMSAGKGIDITSNKISVDAGTGLEFDGSTDAAKLQLDATTRSALTAAGTALQKADVVQGSTNGTISVKGTDVPVKGLGSAAYTDSGAYATAAQGTLATNAVRTVKVNGTALTADSNKAVNVTVAQGSTNGTIAVNGADVAVKGLGTAAYTASSAYATAAQGELAESAVQSVTAATDQMANGTISVDGTAVAVKGLGSAAYTDSGAYATAAQGTLATNAVRTVKVNGTALTADSNKAVNVTVASGTDNGTIAVNGADVAVKGLGSAAYTDSGAYATAAQGTLATNAVRTVKVNGTALTADSNKAVNVTVAQGSTNGTIAVNGTDVSVKGLGTAAYAATTAFDAAGAATAVANKLDDGATGYDIDAKSLKVQGTSVLTTSSSLNGANLTTGSVPTAALANGAVTAAKLGAEIQLYSGWNSGGTPTANPTTVALVAPVHGS